MKNRLVALFLVGTALFLAACSVKKEEAVDVACDELIEVVLESADFPATVPVEDEKIIESDFQLTISDLEDYAIVQQAVSVDLTEVIILKAARGKESELLEQLEARRQQLNDFFAFYPNQAESAAAAVVGRQNQYVYLICHKDAANAEEALLKVLK